MLTSHFDTMITLAVDFSKTFFLCLYLVFNCVTSGGYLCGGYLFNITFVEAFDCIYECHCRLEFEMSFKGI